ncbi:MAG: hypothetical protein N0C81_19165 [Candidatus Thiodiazotropha lotti]|uniref:Uncharacterized protein n=1 Tax=Candidatus Thiodiazotropha lotti TaxID=2792787 RepID=A0A9E4K8V5_9GAMM|nr:hypothetical protein [Candidatus Thiodiazotropha lotti]ODB99978.1 hypothetical protein A3197_06205 [Candidatus Thiodiazotropha endoloripes]MCG7922394.1 hypothetical protein [Candidatus Thiodiazotropha lotti]MCG7930717.1 hypothetical protein [Candidatus Thiodiazotropha lotti]MCG7941349.1 hypothetical protein [Candidatus Thiodiazotropha lotti]
MKSNFVNKKIWIEIFQAIGLTDSKMQLWHQEFEHRHPDGHQEFLEWIDIPAEEISKIRSA